MMFGGERRLGLGGVGWRAVWRMQMLARLKAFIPALLIAGVACWCLPIASASATRLVKVFIRNDTNHEIRLAANTLYERGYPGPGIFNWSTGGGQQIGPHQVGVANSHRREAELQDSVLGVALCSHDLIFGNPTFGWPWVQAGREHNEFRSWDTLGPRKTFAVGDTHWFWDEAIRVNRLQDSERFIEFREDVRKGC